MVQCCNDEQIVLIFQFSAFALSCLVLWSTSFLKPFKLLATFFHEFGHATAVWMTCGKVKGIEVHSDEGGLCTWTHKNAKAASWLVLPAGYLGSVFWGVSLLIITVDLLAAQIGACVLVAMFLIALMYNIFGTVTKREWTMPLLCVFGILVFGGLVGMTFAELRHSDHILVTGLLFFAALNCIFATRDLIDDTIKRKDERSDAYKFAELLKCCPARVVGVVWFLFALFFIAGGFVLTLYLKGDHAAPVKFSDISSETKVHIGVASGVLGLAILLAVAHFLFKK